MIKGDLVMGVGGGFVNAKGIIVGFDEDNDPIVKWFGDVQGSSDIFPGCGEYRKDIVVINESR
tara:strand:- start:358 stop:546 length:189 start_codon:yes stop_codon:yes gene_type:complete